MDTDIGVVAEAAVELLERNLTPFGVAAATPTATARERNYHRVFARDAAICTPGMLATGSAALRNGVRVALETLGEHQAQNGQIPKFVDPQAQDADFWYLGCIDATLWWLLALDDYRRWCGESALAAGAATRVEAALRWLHCQEHPRLHLLQQNEASDWADIMPRSGFVLYTNALWWQVKRRYGLPEQESTAYHFEHLFHPFSRHIPDYRRLRLLQHYVRRDARNRELYLSFVNFAFFGDEGDTLGNLLAIVFGLAGDERRERILRRIERAGALEPVPLRAVLDPIAPDEPLWRDYMGRHRQNLPYQYHNGGAWPFIGGFWVLAQLRAGHYRAAERGLERLGVRLAEDGLVFHEWFHGVSGAPRGMPGQSWSAAMFLWAYYAWRERRLWP